MTPAFLRGTGRMRGAFMVDAHMRRRRTAKATVWRRLEARLNVYRAHLDLLLREVEVEPALALPLFDPLEYVPEDAARIMRMQWRMPSGPVRDLMGWLESAGCLVVAEDFGAMTGGGRVDGLSQWVGDSPVMLVNGRAPTDRLRLTLAHELGHLCLHSAELGGDPEDEANAFAAEFLMPADLIRSELRNLSLGKLHSLKRYWGVSMQALIERAHRLGTLSAQQRTGLYKALSRRGWRTNAPQRRTRSRAADVGDAARQDTARPRPHPGRGSDHRWLSIGPRRPLVLPAKAPARSRLTLSRAVTGTDRPRAPHRSNDGHRLTNSPQAHRDAEPVVAPRPLVILIHSTPY